MQSTGPVLRMFFYKRKTHTKFLIYQKVVYQSILSKAEQENISMGRFFSDPVERALKYIYYDLRSRRGQEGFQLLQQAVQNGDSVAG